MKDRRYFCMRFGPDYLKYDKLFLQQLQKHLNSTFQSYSQENRTNAEYIYDTVDGWVVEELLVDLLKQHFKVNRSGLDSERKIITGKLSSIPDLTVQNGDLTVQIEVQMSNKQLDAYHVKTNKANRLKKAKGKLILVFFVRPLSKFFIVTPQTFDKLEDPKPNPRIGNKMCYEIKKPNLLSPEELVEKIRRVFDKH